MSKNVSKVLLSLLLTFTTSQAFAQLPPPDTETKPPAETSEGEITLNAVDTEIAKIILQIHKVTGKSFILDEQIKAKKITILSEKKMTPDEAYQTFLSALEVVGYTVVPTSTGALKIIQLKDSLQEPIPVHTEDTPNTDSFITRLITLKHVSALDISSAIKPLISKEGNLFAYPATNSLIVTDSGTNIDRLMKIIGQMDTQGPEQIIEIITLKNSAAKDMAGKIQQLYIDQQGTTKKAPAAGKSPEADELPFISKVISDDRTNTVIILASKRAIPKVRELIARLDRPMEGPQGKVHVHALRHAEAKKMAEVLSSLTSGTSNKSAPATSSSGGTATPGQKSSGAPSVAEFEGGVKVTADETTNSLIITATNKDYETLVSEVIDKLDIPRRQVYVEVVIMELSVSKQRDFGVNLFGGTGFTANGNQLIGLGSFGIPGGAIATALTGAGAGGVISEKTFKIPVTGADGKSTNVTVPSFGALITALQQDTDVNVLSTPNILTLDNEEAVIKVGDVIPVQTGSTLTTGGNTTFNVSREDTGIILTLTPQINEGDMVKLKIEQELSSVKGGSSNVTVNLNPTTSKRSVKTVVVAKDQQPIVIGGLVEDKTSTVVQKVPFLGDIPLLGNLFKRKSKNVQKSNLLVFLRPYIIHDTADFLKILQKKVEERNMFVEQNYGKAHQKVIRESVRSHASELLEFKKDIQQRQYEYEPKGKENLDNR